MFGAAFSLNRGAVAAVFLIYYINIGNIGGVGGATTYLPSGATDFPTVPEPSRF